jgi:Flp pilus assembly pilin Flp
VQKIAKLALTKTFDRVHHVCTKFKFSPGSQGTDCWPGGKQMYKLIHQLWSEDAGQDIAEYAVMLAVILVLVVGTVRLIGSNANNVFSTAASSIQ